MGRRRVSMEFIPKRRRRLDTFATRKAGLKKKAHELSVLCEVDVALVLAAADGDVAGGAAAAEVWESRDGVLARYRALAPEARARHTHRGYLAAELGKEEAKLARVRQGGPAGLGRWDRALDGVDTAEEAQRLLEALDAAIRAADGRRTALGMPVDEGGEDGGAGVALEGIAPLDFAAGIDDDDDYLLHHGLGSDGDASDQAIWGDNGGFFQPCSAADMQPGYGYDGFQQCTTSSGVGMEGYHLQMAPGMYGGNSNNLAGAYPYQYQQRDAGAMQLPQLRHLPMRAQCQPNLAPMWSADEPRHAMVLAEYYYYPSADTDLNLNYMDTQPANASQGNGGMSFATGGAKGNFIYSPPALSLAMGTGGGSGNFINAPLAPAALSHPIMGGTGDSFTIATQVQPLAMSYGGDLTNVGRYAAQWQATAPQPQRDGGGQQPVHMEQLHYLSDLEDCGCTYGEANLPSSRSTR